MGKCRKAALFIMAVVFITGLCVFIYPSVRGVVLDRQVSEGAKSFLELVAPQNKQDAPYFPEDIILQNQPIEHRELWDAVNDYNQEIWFHRQANLTDPWAYQQPSFTLGDFGLEDEIFAVITIPAIDLEMPICATRS